MRHIRDGVVFKAFDGGYVVHSVSHGHTGKRELFSQNADIHFATVFPLQYAYNERFMRKLTDEVGRVEVHECSEYRGVSLKV